MVLMSTFAEVRGLLSWLFILLVCAANYGTQNSAHAIRIPRSNYKTCSEKPLETREEMANVVLSGYVDRVMRQPRTMTYDCEIQVVRVFKGQTTLSNEVSPAMSGNKVKVTGFGDPGICDNVAHLGDTRVMLLNRDSGGHLKLNSSLIRITLGNLDRAEAAVSDIPYITREPVTEGPCSVHLCAFGAVCQETDRRKPMCVCPEVCTDVFSPVCGSDEITYMNECYLKAASCTQMKRITVDMEGPCDSSNPCDTKDCGFGAECMLTPDRTMAKCVCPQDCEGMVVSPICGSDGVDYANDCEFRRAMCVERRTIEIIYEGMCDPCDGVEFDDAICVLDFQRRAKPNCFMTTCEDEDVSYICASDGNTYYNDCAMKRAACIRGVELLVYKLGECELGQHPCDTFLCEFGECLVNEDGEPSCDCGPECPEVYKPICGSDGNTYYSMCHLLAHSCNMKIAIEPGDVGICAEEMIEDPCESSLCLYGAICIVENGQAVCSCDLMCTLEVEPVCGSDGMTYGNACHLKHVACEQQFSVTVEYQGPCETCDSTTCEFGAICEMSSSGPECVCPETCVQFESPVCGSDGVTYENECELNVRACQLQIQIYVTSQGSCDECEFVTCEYGSMCNRGSCQCPTCAEIYDPVCTTDMETYSSPCHMQSAMCNQRVKINILYIGECDEMSGSGEGTPNPGSGLEGSGGMPEPLMDCDESNCGFGGVCIDLPNGMAYCSCSMNCSATRKPVCGSDLVMYGSQCIMSEAMCEQQTAINAVSFASCEDVEMEPCDGDLPLTAPDGEEYSCSDDAAMSGCPSGSYCHIHPMGKFSVCCQVTKGEQPTPPSCEETVYGCCPDGMTAAQGRNDAGCPSMCDCNELGSYSPICEPVSQQCACKPGVGGKKCDRCEPGFWDIRGIQAGNIGCRSCACSKGGSVRDDCEQMFGQCTCKPDVSGIHCDVCPEGKTMTSTGCKEDETGEGPQEPELSCEESGCPFNAECQLVEAVPTCVCPSECPAIFEPVCSSDGQTFASECQLRLFSCRLHKEMMVASQGTCETSIQTPTMEAVDCSTTEYGCCPDGISEAMSPGGGGCPTAIPGVSTPIPITADTTSDDLSMVTPPTTTPETGMETDSMNMTESYGMNMTESNVTDDSMATEQTVTSPSNQEMMTNETMNETDSTNVTTEMMMMSSDMISTESMIETDRTMLTTAATPSSAMTTEMLSTVSTVAPTTEEPPINVLGCASDPCLHGGTCVDHDDIPGFLCACPIGKGGPVCEQEVTFELPSFMKRSYLAFPKMSAYFNVEIVLEFQTETDDDAILLWNGQVGFNDGDFISLAVVDGFVEFRYDLIGSLEDMVIIRSTVPVKTQGMHRIKATRERRTGTLSVDDEPEISGESLGSSSGLSLTTDLHLGNGPPELKEKVSKQTGVEMGLHGCIRTLEINQEPFVLTYPGGDILYGADVGECGGDPCLSNPCLNNGSCESTTAVDFTCSCINNFIGPLCGDIFVDQCEGHMCHHTSTCVPLPEGGYRCDCPMGRKGDTCDKVMEMEFIPAFSSNSYIELPAIEGEDAITVEVEFLTEALNGLIFYNGDSAEIDGDFISLNIKDGFLEYRFDLGSGPSEIRSLQQITLQEWHTVEVTRVGKDGMMIVDGGTPATGESQGVSSELNLDRSLFLGGVNNFTMVSRKAGFTDGLQGGIRRLAVNNREMFDFVKRAISEVNIVEYMDDVCKNMPCLETYNCRTDGQGGYVCECPEGFVDLYNECVSDEGSGEGSGGEDGNFIDKDIITDEMIPEHTNRITNPKTTPKLTSAQIVMSTKMTPKMTTGRKTTPQRTTGKESTPRQTTRLVTTQRTTTEAMVTTDEAMTAAPVVDIDSPIYLDGMTVFNYPNLATASEKGQGSNIIEVTFRTRNYEGMILYNGVGPAPKMGDFLFLAVVKGEVTFGFNLGMGFKGITSPVFVADDEWHTIIITRQKQEASLTVDNEMPISGQSKAGASQLNTDGVLWIGGYQHEYPDNVYEKYRNPFKGCIKDVKLDERELHLYHHATDDQPIEFCPAN